MVTSWRRTNQSPGCRCGSVDSQGCIWGKMLVQGPSYKLHELFRFKIEQKKLHVCPTYLDGSWVSYHLQPPREFPAVLQPSETLILKNALNGFFFQMRQHFSYTIHLLVLCVSFDLGFHCTFFSSSHVFIWCKVILQFLFPSWVFTSLLLFAKLFVSPGSSTRL